MSADSTDITDITIPHDSPERAFRRACGSMIADPAAERLAEPFLTSDEPYESREAFTRAAAEGLSAALPPLLKEAGLPEDLLVVDAQPEKGYVILNRRAFPPEEREACGFAPPPHAHDAEPRCVAVLFCEPFVKLEDAARPIVPHNTDPRKVVGLVTAETSVQNLSVLARHSGVDVVYHTRLSQLLDRLIGTPSLETLDALIEENRVTFIEAFIFEDLRL